MKVFLVGRVLLGVVHLTSPHAVHQAVLGIVAQSESLSVYDTGGLVSIGVAAVAVIIREQGRSAVVRAGGGVGLGVCVIRFFAQNHGIGVGICSQSYGSSGKGSGPFGFPSVHGFVLKNNND